MTLIIGVLALVASTIAPAAAVEPHESWGERPDPATLTTDDVRGGQGDGSRGGGLAAGEREIGATPFGDFVEATEVDTTDLAEEWTERSVDLSEWSGQEVCVAFVLFGSDTHAWNIDDVAITSDGETVLEESFADGQVPPDGWAAHEFGDAPGWFWGEGGHSAGGSAVHPFAYPSELANGWLVTAAVELGDDAELSYVDRFGESFYYTYSGVWVGTGDCDPSFPRSDIDPAGIVAIGQPDAVEVRELRIANTLVGELEWELAAAEGCDHPSALDWLAVSPTSGAVTAGEEDLVSLELSAVGLSAGLHGATLCLDSNDPSMARRTLPITFRIIEAPELEVTPSAVDVEVVQGESDGTDLRIANAGQGELSWQVVAGDTSVAIDNGPFVTNPGEGPDGSDVSLLQDVSMELALMGSNVGSGDGFTVSDSFEIDGTEAWELADLTFFAFTSDGVTTSPFDQVTYQIWDGKPYEAESTVVYGDSTTNRLMDTYWTGAHRVSESRPEVLYPIMAVVAEGGVELDPGTYWVQWSIGTTGAGGAWQPPVTILGEATTGEALQHDGFLWRYIIDLMWHTHQGVPFEVTGARQTPHEVTCDLPADIPWLDMDAESGAATPEDPSDVALTVDASDLDLGTHEALLCVTGGAGTAFWEIPVAVRVIEPDADDGDDDSGDDDPGDDDPGDDDPGDDDPGDGDSGAEPPAGVTRLAGETRIETAVRISAASFDDGEAASVVLARADGFADALAGTPLAAARSGPVLVTPTEGVVDVVADEVARVLADDGTVYVLGGTAALDAQVDADLRALGHEPVRLAGPERTATSLAVAAELGAPEHLLVTSGHDFPDALAAGAAAAQLGGAVVLTAPDVPDPQVDAHLEAYPQVPVTAVGGPAARAYPSVAPLVGSSRVETAALVADAFFDDHTAVGIARHDEFADALAGGAHVARWGGPLLLTPSDDLHPVTAAHVCGGEELRSVFAYGGTAALSDQVLGALGAHLDGEGCG